MAAKKLGKFAFCKEKQNARGFFVVKTFECDTLEQAQAKMDIHKVGFIIDRTGDIGRVVASNRKFPAKKVVKPQAVGVLTKKAGWLTYR